MLVVTPGHSRRRLRIALAVCLPISIGVVTISCYPSGSRDTIKSVIVTEPSVSPDGADAKDDAGEKADIEAFRKLVIAAAAARRASIDERTAADLTNAGRDAASTAESITSAESYAPAIKEDLARLARRVAESERRLSPDVQFVTKLPVQLVQTAVSRISAANPSAVIASLDPLAKDQGALTHRIGPVLRLASELDQILNELKALQAAPASDENPLPPAAAAALAAKLQRLLQSSRDLGQLQQNVEILHKVALAIPSILDPSVNAGVNDRLASVRLVFTDGRMQLAVEAASELFNGLIDLEHFTAAARKLDFDQEGVERRISTLEAARLLPSTLAFSDRERAELVAALSIRSRHWSLEQLTQEATYRADGESCRAARPTAFTEAACAFDAVALISRSLQPGTKLNADKSVQLLTDGLNAIEQAQGSAARLQDAHLLADLPSASQFRDRQALAHFLMVRDATRSPDLELMAKLTGTTVDRLIELRWFGLFASEANFAYWEHIRETVEAALLLVEDSTNLSVQGKRLAVNATRSSARTAELPHLAKMLETDRIQLQSQTSETERRASLARSLMPNVALDNVQKLAQQDLSPVLDAWRDVEKIIDGRCGAVMSLRDATSRLTTLRGLGGAAALSPAERGELTKSLSVVSMHFRDLLDPECLRLTRGNRKRRELGAVDRFVSTVTQLQARLSGFSRDAVDGGLVAATGTFESYQAFDPLRQLSSYATRAEEQRAFAQSYRRAASWLDPMLGLNIANEATVFATGGVLPLALGAAGIVNDPIRLIHYPEPFPNPFDPRTVKFQIDDYVSAKIPGVFPATLGAANAGLLTYGTWKEINQGLKIQRSTFDIGSKLLGSLSIKAKIADPNVWQSHQGSIFVLPRDRSLLLEVSAPPLTPAQVLKQGWTPSPVLRSGVFTMIGNQRYYWTGAARLQGTRVRHFGLAALSGLGAVRIIRGLPHTLDNLINGRSGGELVRAGKNVADRFLDGAYLAGLVVNAKQITDSIRFKLVARHGGYFDAREPKAVPICLQTAEGQEELLLKRDGRILVKRFETDATYFDSPEGTVEARKKKSRGFGKLLTRLGLRSDYQIYVPSKAENEAALRSLTQSDGYFISRRAGSAQMVSQGVGKRSVKEGVRRTTFSVGEPVDLSIGPIRRRVRPYYASPGDSRLPASEFRGVLLDPSATSSGPVREEALIYKTTEPQLLQRWNSLVREGEMVPVEPALSEIRAKALLSEVEAAAHKQSTHWELDLNGAAHLRSPEGGAHFSLSVNAGGVDISDKRFGGVSHQSRITTDGGLRLIAQSTVSLSGMAKYAALASTDGQWLRIGDLPGEVSSPDREFAVAEVPNARMYWDSKLRSWRAIVATPGPVFTSAGVYQFEPGVARLRKELADMENPFEWRRPLPGLTPDFKHELRAPRDLKEIRTLPDGSKEIRYSFRGSGSAFDGVFAVHRGQAYRIENSLPAIRYRQEIESASARSYWLPLWVLPSSLGPLAWVGGAVPREVETHIRQHWGQPGPLMDAGYAFDSAAGRFILRVAVHGDSQDPQTYIFAPARNAAEYSRLQVAKETDAEVYAALPPGLPDALIARSPALLQDLAAFAKSDGIWGVREPSRKGIETAQNRLTAGGPVILDSSICEQFIAPSFEKREKTLTCRKDEIVTYRGLSFTTCLASGSFAVLQAQESGDLPGPGSEEKTSIVPGQLVLVDPGTSLAEIKIARSRLQSVLPEPRRIIKTAAALARENPLLAPHRKTLDVLPAYLRKRLDNGDDVHIRHIGAEGFFEIVPPGSPAPPGAVWYLPPSEKQTADYVKFNRGRKPRWSISNQGWKSISEDFWNRTAKPGPANELVPDKAPTPPFSFVDDKTKAEISGYLIKPVRPNPFAPTLLQVQKGGAIYDPILGNIVVGEGDTLILRIPLAVQLDVARAKSGDAMLRLDPKSGDVSTPGSADFATEAFGGIVRSQDVGNLAYPADTLVQTLKSADVVQVLPRAPLLRWLEERQRGLGYIAMDTGEHVVSFNGKSRSLAGLIGIGGGTEQLPAKWVRAHELVVCDGVETTYLTESDKIIGRINYGEQAVAFRRTRALEVAESLRGEASDGPPYQHEDVLFWRELKKPGASRCEARYENVLTGLMVEEERRGNLLFRTFLAQDNHTPIRRVTYRLSAGGVRTPLYLTEGSPKSIAESYRVQKMEGETFISSYGPDGQTLLSIQVMDGEGHLLRRWSAQNNTLEINYFDGRTINAAARRQALTRSETYRLTGDERKSAGALPVPKTRPTAALLGTTFYSPVAGRLKPLFHVDKTGSIDEVYDSKAFQAHPDQQILRVHAEVPGGEADPWKAKNWGVLSHRRLRLAAQKEATFGEIRQRDALGRVTTETKKNDAEEWKTCHDYSGNTLLHSRIRYRRAKTERFLPVADIYYPGLLTLDEALRKGIAGRLSSFASNESPCTAAAPKPADIADRLKASEWLGGSGSRGGLEDLLCKTSQLTSLSPRRLDAAFFRAQGLTDSTMLESSVVVPHGGGVSVLYRLPEDPLGRVVMVDLGFSRTLGFEWEGADTTRSVSVLPDNNILGTFRTRRVKNRAVPPVERTRLNEVLGSWYSVPYLDYAAARLAPSSANGPLTELTNAFGWIGIKPTSIVTAVEFTPQKIFHQPDGKLYFSPEAAIDATQVYHRVPDDPLGNYAVQANVVGREGASLSIRPDVGSVNLWWRRGQLRSVYPKSSCGPEIYVPPIDVSPGTFSVQRSSYQANARSIFSGLMEFEGRRPEDPAPCNTSIPSLSRLKPQVQNIAQTLAECCSSQLNPPAATAVAAQFSQAVDGYWYHYIAGGDYLEREFHERNSGRVLMREYTQLGTVIGRQLGARISRIVIGALLSIPMVIFLIQLGRLLRNWRTCARAVLALVVVSIIFAFLPAWPAFKVPSKRQVYYDITGPFSRPILATNEKGQITAVWLATIFNDDGGQTQTIRVKDPLVGTWQMSIQQTDVDGIAHVPEVNWHTVLTVSLVIVVGCPLLLTLLLAWIGSRGGRWEAFAETVRAKRSAAFGDDSAYDRECVELAINRIAERVLSVDPETNQASQLKRPGRGEIYTTDGVAECGFLFYLYPIYAAVIGWRRDCAPKSDPESDNFLANLDRYAIAAGRHLVEELSFGRRSEIRFYAEDRSLLKCDPDIWEKLTAFLQVLFIRLRNSKDPQSFESILAEYGISGAAPGKDPQTPMDFGRSAKYREFLEEGRWDTPNRWTFNPKLRRYSPRTLAWIAVGSRWGANLRRFLGWHTRSIHVYAGQEIADLLPSFFLAFVGIGLVFTNDLSALTPVAAQWSSLAIVIAAVFLACLGCITEWVAMSTSGRFTVPQNRLTVSPLVKNVTLGAASLALAYAISRVAAPTSQQNLGVFFLKIVFAGLAIMEALGYWVLGHSLVGLSVYHHCRPTIDQARPRVRILFLLQTMAFLVTAVLIADLTYSWWLGHYSVASQFAEQKAYRSLAGAVVYLVVTLYLINSGLWFLLTGFISLFKTFHGWWLAARRPQPPPAENSRPAGVAQNLPGTMVINYVGHSLSSPIFVKPKAGLSVPTPNSLAERYVGALLELVDRNAESVTRHLSLLCEFAGPTGRATPPRSRFQKVLHRLPVLGSRLEQRIVLREFVNCEVRAWLTNLFREELRNGVSLLHHSQLALPVDLNMAGDLRFQTDEPHWKLLVAVEIVRQLALNSGVVDRSVDTAIHLMDIAESLGSAGLSSNTMFVQTYNKFESKGDLPGTKSFNDPEDAQCEKIGRLFTYLSGGAGHAITFNWTNGESKSGAMNGLLTYPHELSQLRVLHILDRNANCFQMEKLMRDYSAIRTNRDLIVRVPLRNTSNTYDPVGRQSEAIEGGQGSTFIAVPDKIGTGWENLMAVYFGDVMSAMSIRDYPITPLSGEAHRQMSEAPNPVKDFEYFGLVGFGPHAIGQSEDLWAVMHQTHNAIGLGRVPCFEVMEAPATKLREYQGSFDILRAATRWAGGLVDTLRSPINQTIGFFGPESIFERKARRSVERFYLAAPVGVFSIAFLFPAILLDMNPFVGILLAFWVAAFLFNQVLSLHGLVASLRARGSLSAKYFNWLLPIAGLLSIAAGAGSVYWVSGVPALGWASWLMSILVFGIGSLTTLLSIVSPAGFSYWLLKRLPDIILFAPRYFIEASAVLFHLSGGDHSFARSPSGGKPEGTARTLLRLAGLLEDRRDPRALFFALSPLLLAGLILLLAAWVTAAGLDFNNIILLWLVLSFVGGAAVGFFTEDFRPGKYHAVLDPLSSLVGTLWGITAVWALYYYLHPAAQPLVPLIGAGAFWSLGGALALDGLWRFESLSRLVIRSWKEKSEKPKEGKSGVRKAKPEVRKEPVKRPALTVVRRTLSNLERCAIRAIAVLGWFAIVEIPDTLRASLLPNQPVVANIGQAIVWLFIAGGIFLAIASFGAVTSKFHQHELWRRFEGLVRANQDTLRVDSKRKALMAEFLVKMGLGHWADARESLELFSIAPPPPLVGPPSPDSLQGPPISPVPAQPTKSQTHHV